MNLIPVLSSHRYCFSLLALCMIVGSIEASEPLRVNEIGATDDRLVDAADSASSTSAIKSILSKQAKAWNEGDIDEFMEYYWKSEKLTFSSGGKTTRGWAKTKANYKRRYPTKKDMGKVTFAKIEFLSLGKGAALVLGRWNLERESDPIGGNFSLVFRRIEGRWVIIHDHTSRSEPPEKKTVQKSKS